jgi:Protein of unknown function (DUF3352)
MSRRLATAAVALAAALAVAACGGTTRHQSGGIGDSGASLIRSGALAYVAVDSDLGSSQWQQVDSLLKKFPARDKLIAQLRHSLSGEGLDYDRDVKGALGPEVDVAVTGGGGQQPAVVALTKPDSMDKAKALVRKLNKSSNGSPAVTREVDGWLAVSDKEASFDRVLKGSSADSLADDSTFKDAIGALPGDALAKAYVDGRQLADLVDRYMGAGARTTAAGGTASPFANVDWLAAAVDAKDNGIRLQVDGKGSGAEKSLGANFASNLISGVPADAFVFADFRGTSLGGQIARLRQNPAFGQGLGDAEKQLGIRLDDVLALFEHEVAFYVRRGPGLPEFSLALETPDTQSALTTIDRLAARIANLTRATIGSDNQGGVPVKTLTIKPVTVRWAGFDGRVLLTTGPTGISDYRAGGSKLADDDAYKHALDAAGAPDKTSGVFYVNIRDAAQLLTSYLAISGRKMPQEIAANLKPLQSFLAYSSTSGDVTKGVAFLEIK